MRKLIIALALLVGLGLVLLFTSRSAEPGASEENGQEATAERAGTVPQPESPEDVGARGTADAGSTPSLAQAPQRGRRGAGGGGPRGRAARCPAPA